MPDALRAVHHRSRHKIRNKAIEEVFHDAECLHGGVDTGETKYGMTSFPQAISLAAAFDRDMLYDIASMISDEMRAVANLYRQADGSARWSMNISMSIHV